jgi:hypothetical protein
VSETIYVTVTGQTIDQCKTKAVEKVRHMVGVRDPTRVYLNMSDEMQTIAWRLTSAVMRESSYPGLKVELDATFEKCIGSLYE